jgi:hypothetical protein
MEALASGEQLSPERFDRCRYTKRVHCCHNGTWFRLGAWTFGSSTEGQGVENLVYRQNMLLSLEAIVSTGLRAFIPTRSFASFATRNLKRFGFLQDWGSAACVRKGF